MLPATAGSLLARPRAMGVLYRSGCPGHATLLSMPGFRSRPGAPMHRLSPVAVYKPNPKYNKYRDRQEVEKEYYREWERTTALKEDYGRHEPTVWSTLATLPLIIKYYAIPGPIRYLLFWLGQLLGVVARKIQRQLVLAEYRLGVVLARRAGGQQGPSQLRMALLRWHNRISLLEGVKYWASLLRGKAYMPELLPPELDAYGPNYVPQGTVDVLPAAA